MVARLALLVFRKKRTRGSPWTASEPALQGLHWMDVALLVALALAFLSIGLAAFYRFSVTPSLVLCGILMIALVAWWLGRRSDHLSAIERWSLARGHRFHRRASREIRRKYKGLSLPQWHAHCAPVVGGRYQGLSFLAFEYHVPGHQERYDNDRSGTVVVLFSDRELTRLEIHRRDPEDGSSSGGVKLELAAFNEAFRMETDDPRWAFKVLNQEGMERLLQSPRFHEIIFQRDAIVVRHRVPLEPEGIEAALDLSLSLLSRIPPLEC